MQKYSNTFFPFIYRHISIQFFQISMLCAHWPMHALVIFHLLCAQYRCTECANACLQQMHQRQFLSFPLFDYNMGVLKYSNTIMRLLSDIYPASSYHLQLFDSHRQALSQAFQDPHWSYSHLRTSIFWRTSSFESTVLLFHFGLSFSQRGRVAEAFLLLALASWLSRLRQAADRRNRGQQSFSIRMQMRC